MGKIAYNVHWRNFVQCESRPSLALHTGRVIVIDRSKVEKKAGYEAIGAVSTWWFD